MTYTKNLEHIAIGLIAGKLIARAVEAEHKLLRTRIRLSVVQILVSHDGVLRSAIRIMAPRETIYERKV